MFGKYFHCITVLFFVATEKISRFVFNSVGNDHQIYQAESFGHQCFFSHRHSDCNFSYSKGQMNQHVAFLVVLCQVFFDCVENENTVTGIYETGKG